MLGNKSIVSFFHYAFQLSFWLTLHKNQIDMGLKLDIVLKDYPQTPC